MFHPKSFRSNWMRRSVAMPNGNVTVCRQMSLSLNWLNAIDSAWTGWRSLLWSQMRGTRVCVSQNGFFFPSTALLLVFQFIRLAWLDLIAAIKIGTFPCIWSGRLFSADFDESWKWKRPLSGRKRNRPFKYLSFGFQAGVKLVVLRADLPIKSICKNQCWGQMYRSGLSNYKSHRRLRPSVFLHSSFWAPDWAYLSLSWPKVAQHQGNH